MENYSFIQLLHIVIFVFMDKFKDIIDNIKDRVSNPLIFSFICAWVAVNWEIVVALLYYDSKAIEKEHYATIYEFISAKLSESGAILIPFVIAVAYTVLMPFIKAWLKVLNSWVEKITENRILQINRDGKISIDRYLILKKNLEQKKVDIENMVNEESMLSKELHETEKKFYNASTKNNHLEEELKVIRTELQQQKKEISTYRINEKNLKEQVNLFSKEIDTFSKQKDISFLNGRWHCVYSGVFPLVFKGDEEAIIENGKYYIVNNGGRMHIFNIEAYRYETDNKVFFVKNRVKLTVPWTMIAGRVQDLKYNYNALILADDGSLVGKENGATDIKYTRIIN